MKNASEGNVPGRSEQAAGGNPTIPYSQEVRPYHAVLAELTERHAEGAGGLLLDVGCGVGNTLVEIRKRRLPMRFVVADVDPECLRLTCGKVPVERKVLLTNKADLDLAERFDVILLSHTLHYEPEPTALVRRLINLLVPNGLLLLATPNPSTPTKFLHNVVRRPYSEGLFTWDRSVLAKFLAQFPELAILETTHDYLPLPFLSKSRVAMPALKALARLLPWLSFSVIVALRKRPE